MTEKGANGGNTNVTETDAIETDAEKGITDGKTKVTENGANDGKTNAIETDAEKRHQRWQNQSDRERCQ